MTGVTDGRQWLYRADMCRMITSVAQKGGVAMFEAIGLLVLAWIGFNILRSLINRIRNGPTASSNAGNGDSGDSSWADDMSDGDGGDSGSDGGGDGGGD